MRIIQLLPSLDDGGAETLVKDYAIKLAETQEVYVVTVFNFTKSSNYRLLKKAGIKIVPLTANYNLITRVFIKFFGHLYIPHRLKNVWRKIKPDVVHIHLELLKPVSAIIEDVPKTRLFFTCHNEPHAKFGPRYPGELDALKKLCTNYSLRVIALHDKMRKELNNLIGIDNTLIVYNCIPMRRFTNNMEKRAVVRNSLSIDEDTILLGHVGRFSEAKNHTFLLDIANQVMKIEKKARLLLVGDGALVSSIKKKAENLGIIDKIIFLSHRTDVPDLLRAMDVFVFPSIFEGFPVTLIETQAVGLPCVVSDAITSESFISPNVYPMSLNASAMEWAVQTMSIARNFIYDKRIEKFNIDNIIIQLIRIYKE